MATLADIRAGLAARAATIAGLSQRSHAVWPDTIVAPAVVIDTGDIVYHEDGGHTHYELALVLFAAPIQVGYPRGQVATDLYRDAAGASSLKAAVEAEATLGGKVSDTIVRSAGRTISLEYQGVEYWGCRFAVGVWA